MYCLSNNITTKWSVNTKLRQDFTRGLLKSDDSKQFTVVSQFTRENSRNTSDTLKKLNFRLSNENQLYFVRCKDHFTLFMFWDIGCCSVCELVKSTHGSMVQVSFKQKGLGSTPVRPRCTAICKKNTKRDILLVFFFKGSVIVDDFFLFVYSWCDLSYIYTNERFSNTKEMKGKTCVKCVRCFGAVLISFLVLSD